MNHLSTFYDLLGICHTASASEITRAYRQAVRQYHPDQHGNSVAAHEILTQINLAGATLRDPVARTKYDAMLAVHSVPTGLSSMQTAGYDATYTVTISAAEARTGTERTLQFHGPDGAPRPFTLTIPSEVLPDTVYVFPGAGGPSRDGTRHGNLRVKVQILCQALR